MEKKQRPFRGDESIAAEQISRDAVMPFLNSRGFTQLEDRRKVAGSAIEQFIVARSPAGDTIQMRIRLCWRREGRNPSERKYAAAQLRARLIDNNWEGTLNFIAERDRERGNTHNLILQRDGAVIVMAALIPSNALLPIWMQQRDVSQVLQSRNLMGRIAKNHAMNGSSPTVWLMDDRVPDAHQVADVLWNWPGVVDVAKMPMVDLGFIDDTFDDCQGIDYSSIGSDNAPRHFVLRSEVKRDMRVRRAVIARALSCERTGCSENRPYAGFLDVHHILGVEKSDRPWNCVALCPNCHREAHFAPDSEEINADLLHYATQFRVVG
jgi:5-methylcytosine-specific restriction protein A